MELNNVLNEAETVSKNISNKYFIYDFKILNKKLHVGLVGGRANQHVHWYLLG